MDWLNSLLWDPSSVAHIVLLYSFVIAIGVMLGKIKVAGISLGVTFVLFMGILMGHFGIRSPEKNIIICSGKEHPGQDTISAGDLSLKERIRQNFSRKNWHTSD